MKAGLVAAILDRKRLVFFVAGLLTLAGLTSWLTMPRQEDPRLADRVGVLQVPFPGADAETIERLVVEPLEDELAQVDAIKNVESTARADVAIVVVQLRDAVTKIDEAWDEVEAAVAVARREMPANVLEPALDDGIITNQETVVLAVTGTADRLRLEEAAKRIQRVLLRDPDVSRVFLSGEADEEVVVEYDDALARRLGVPAGRLVQDLRLRNQTIPGGTIRLGGRSAAIDTGADYDSLDELARTPVMLASGTSIPLDAVARVSRRPREPLESRVRFNGVPAVGVGVVAREGIDVVRFGERIRERVDTLRGTVAPLEIHELSFQPDAVSERLSDLGLSLLMGMLIVAVVLFLVMGRRLGAVVTAIVPVVALSSLALYAMGGGLLHQISIAALVIALGMLVDNAIVVAENVQQRLDDGASPRDASAGAVRELVVPLATATLTTLAAFVPMVASSGPTADFTRAIPVVIMLTLTVSYVFAVFVTPALAQLVLARRDAAAKDRFGWARGAGRIGVRRPKTVLAVAGVALALSGLGAGFVDASFFPAAGRNQFVIEVLLPEGTHLLSTDDVVSDLENVLLGDKRVKMVSSFVGRAAPKFYYNLPTRPKSPHFAHVVVTTNVPADVPHLFEVVEAHDQEVPGAEIIPRQLEQGPPLDAPVEVRLLGDDLESLHAAADVVLKMLRELEGTRHVRHDLGVGTPTLEVAVDDAAAGRRGVTRADVGVALLRQTRGLVVDDLRFGREPVPVVVRATAGEALPPQRVGSTAVEGRTGTFTPLAHIATTGVSWRPSAVHHRNGRRVTTVSAQLADGVPFGRVLSALKPRLEAADLPEGVEFEFGGAAEGSGEANLAILRTAPVGALMLLFFLLLEFNSFRRVAIILTTIPLAAAGVVPGLLIADQPFGFMSLLGVIALVGVVVNNAIVLLDVVERKAEQMPLTEAIEAAVALRARPILLTTATTVAGLLPLALSTSPLWPPLASAMIAGLIASTALTLLVVPALYRLAFEGWRTA